MLLVELQNTCKKVEQKNARKTQHLLYFLKAVNTIQLVPTMQKKLFTSSFQEKIPEN